MPSTPIQGPQCDYSETDTSRITVRYEEPFAGGDVLISMQVQMDDGQGSGFITIAEHLLTKVTVSEGISRGENYRFRYRAFNSVGWSSFSPTVIVIAAKVPEPPGKIKILSSTANSITVQMAACPDS